MSDEIDRCARGSTDSFLNSFKEVVKTSIGLEFSPFIEHTLIEVGEGRLVLCVDCEPCSPQLCFLYGEHFFVRTNPATDELKGRALAEYIRSREAASQGS